MSKNILNLQEEEARKFLLKEESYFTADLPAYFTFSDLLNKLSKELDSEEIVNFYSSSSNSAANFENVNHKILSNKAGKYAWRSLQLIHPVLYVVLVHTITKKENWKTLKERCEKFKNDKITCVSLPAVSERIQTNKAEQISHWWEEMEQKSIELALDYDYLYQIDIADCYGSIYTHSVAWAIYGKSEAKKKRNENELLGNQIDKLLRSMSNGQTNGIPQGSVLMDFIAEIVLGYADLLFEKEMHFKEGFKILRYRGDFKILRYRDDYRIFVNDPQIAENIIKNLTEVLGGLGLNLNDQKIIKSNNIVKNAIRPDKLYRLITNKIRPENKVKSVNTLQEELYIISDIAEKYPNSGSVSKLLTSFHRSLKIKKATTKNIKRINAFISIVVDITFKNPRTYPISMAIISELIECLDSEKKIQIIKKIQNKFKKIPNTGHLELWLQRLTLKINDEFEYDETLCKKVKNNNTEVWYSVWLEDPLKKIINETAIVDRDKIEKMQPAIGRDEVGLFKQYPYN